jgi:hypothetical protein
LITVLFEPPAKIANPAFGRDVAARLDRFSLRAAVVCVPAIALKMSTILETEKGRLPACNKTMINNKTPQHKQIQTKPRSLSKSEKLITVRLYPPAKIANPAFGRDVAAIRLRASLRAAVVQVPAIELKMSTALESTVPENTECNKRMINNKTLNTTN